MAEMLSSGNRARPQLMVDDIDVIMQDGGENCGMLTPRSKIRALLASVDDNSESEDQAQHVKSSEQRKILGELDVNARARSAPIDDPTLDPSKAACSHSDDDDFIIPRGRLATRLQTAPEHLHKGRRISGSESDQQDAYTRVRKRLLQTQPPEAVEGNLNAQDVSMPTIPLSQDASCSVVEHRGEAHGEDLARNNGVASPPSSETSIRQSPCLSKSDDELPNKPHADSRFLALVAKKRAEREAREKEEHNMKQQKNTTVEDGPMDSNAKGPLLSEEEEADVDGSLTQHNRPTRKASKKAIEEMNRETQRMSRNMQLAHLAKTKKKFSKGDLLARFSFLDAPNSLPIPIAGKASTPSSSTASEHEAGDETPATSPLAVHTDSEIDVSTLNSQLCDAKTPPKELSVETVQADLPDMVDVLTAPISVLEAHTVVTPTRLPSAVRPEIRARQITANPSMRRIMDDSDSDLEVEDTSRTKGARLALLKRGSIEQAVPGRALHTLRTLANVHNSPPGQKRGAKQSVSFDILQDSLRRKARQQAIEERNAKIESLRAKGIIIETAEEKQTAQCEVEDMLERARQEAIDLKDKERRAERKAKHAEGIYGDMNDTDGDDEYSEDEAAEVASVLSDSDDVGEQDADCEEEDDSEDENHISIEQDSNIVGGDRMVEAINPVDADPDTEIDHQSQSLVYSDTPQINALPNGRSRRARNVVPDDDEEEALPLPQIQMHAQSQLTHDAVPIAIPDIFQTTTVPMGMTQAFAATMGDTQGTSDIEEGTQAFLPFVGPPEPFIPVLHAQDSISIIEETQEHVDTGVEQNTARTAEIDLGFTQSQIDHYNGKQQDFDMTQLSEIPDPTQDAGFTAVAPVPQRYSKEEPSSTVDTVILEQSLQTSPPHSRVRGKLHQRGVRQESPEIITHDHTTEDNGDTNRTELPNDAFAAMARARRQEAKREAFIKKKSGAKDMIEEQAQESEDEYAGLGGASDDESGEEMDAQVEAMLDERDIDVNERELAALHADQQRIDDEKAVSKLFKDINNGGLRRKRGAAGQDFDLSDSDDDAEARRRRKQREFAKMRAALLENENVGKIAEDPKKKAFLAAIEDREIDEEMDFLNNPAEESFRVESNTQTATDTPIVSERETQDTTTEVSQTPSADHPVNRAPAIQRRTVVVKRPATLAEIRESVSFLVEDPGSFNLATEGPSSSADEADPQAIEDDDLDISDEEGPAPNDQNAMPPPARPSKPVISHKNPRRVGPKAVIDRITLKRNNSSSSSASSSLSTTSHLAFHKSSDASSAFLPSLLRRASTSNLLGANAADANGISHAATERASGGREQTDYVKRGGRKGSSISSFKIRTDSLKGDLVQSLEQRRQVERQRLAGRRTGLIALGRVSSWES